MNSTEPEIKPGNMHGFYLLNQEFQILMEYLRTKIDEACLILSILISNLNDGKSENERYISIHLSDIINIYSYFTCQHFLSSRTSYKPSSKIL